MGQLRFPKMHPGFVRIEAVDEGELGWTLTVCEAESRGLFTHADRRTYEFLSWDELSDAVAAVMDGVVATERR